MWGALSDAQTVILVLIVLFVGMVTGKWPKHT